MGQTFANGGQLIRQNQIVQNPNDGTVELELAARHYYGADDRLMAVQRYSWRSPSSSDGTWEEYWYDALGRRILTRARRDVSSIYDASVSGPLCMGGIQCRSFTERVWWDGDQSLVEERTAEGVSDVSNNGVVGNIHGLTLDEPLAVITDQTRIVNYNWRGLGKSSVFPNGQAGDNSLGNPATEIDWPAGTQAQTYFTPGPGSGSSNPKRWMGTFVANGQGTTGMLYRRNRYFNPSSGQFTQADPAGIAGGTNAFGFASGDPISYSDPFGLADCKKDEEQCPNPIRQVMDDMVAAATSLYVNALDAVTETINLWLPLKSAVTAAGLNPNAQGGGARGGAGVSVALALILPGAGVGEHIGIEEGRAVLQGLMAGDFYVMAGAGAKRPFRAAANLAGDAADWQYRTSTAVYKANGFAWQAHWAHNIVTGENAMAKLKFLGTVR